MAPKPPITTSDKIREALVVDAIIKELKTLQSELTTKVLKAEYKMAEAAYADAANIVGRRIKQLRDGG